MADRDFSGVLRFLHRVKASAELDQLSDRQLLERFAGQRDQCAFAALVERHGPLVYHVCKTGLRHDQDAEDAFQAAFLVLARKAGSVAWQDSVASWLYAVASRVTAEARTKKYRRLLREKTNLDLPETPVPETDMAEANHWHTLLHQEIGKLPEKYRAPLLLCYLEGMSREDAARQLGWTLGTVKGRLERGRDLLRERLARRGVTSPAAVSALLAPSLDGLIAPAIPLVEQTVSLCGTWALGQTIAGNTSILLAERVLRLMTLSGWKKLGVLLVLAAGLGAGIVYGFSRGNDPQPPLPPIIEKMDPQAKNPPAAVQPPRYDQVKPAALAALLHPDIVRGLALSPAGDQLVTSCYDGNTRLWDLASGEVVRFWKSQGQNSAAAMAPDGSYLVFGNDHGDLAARRLPDGGVLYDGNAVEGQIFHLAFSPDGQVLAAANKVGSVTLWEAAGGKKIVDLKAHQGRRVWSVAFSPDSAMLASAGEDGSVCLWDVAGGKLLRTWIAHIGMANAVVFHPEGKVLASCGMDHTIRLWNLDSKEPFLEIQAPWVQALAFAPGGAALASGDSEGVHLWDAKSGRRLHKLEGPQGVTYSLAFSRDGRLLVAGGTDNVLRRWRLEEK